MYLSIAVKLLIGMLGLILFLRISGKTQMAQLTPLDSVNSFVLGALVGGVIYNPDTPVWYLLFAFAIWTAVNVALRYMMRFRRLRRAIKGDPVMIVRDGRLVLDDCYNANPQSVTAALEVLGRTDCEIGRAHV